MTMIMFNLIVSIRQALVANKVVFRLLFPFNSCYVIFIEWTFYYFVTCKCLSTIVRVNDAVQFTFSLVKKLNFTIATISLFIIVCIL